MLLSAASFSQIPSSFQVWKYPSGRINSSVLVVDSTVYVGDMNGKFSKLNANTGQEIWSYQAENYIASHAAYKDGVVVFESGDKLHGLDAKTGNLLWSYKSTDKKPTVGYDTGWHHSSPAVEGNTAYFGDEWGNMNGVNLKTGKIDFQYHIPFSYDVLTDYNIRTMPVILDSIIYFGDYEGRIYAISLKDKSEKWITKMETPRWDGSIVSEIVIDNGVLYCGRYTNAFIPLDLKTGTPLWKFSEWETFLPSTPLIYKDQIIIGTTINVNKIFSLKKSTGEKNWEIKAKGIFFVRPIIIQDSILVINSTDPFADKWGILYFINLEKGAIINEIHLQNATESSPIFYKDMIIIGGNDGLFAFNYKPAIAAFGLSNIIFDDVTESDTILISEPFDKSFPLTNASDFCDTVNVSFEITGDESKSNISFIEKKGFHIRPTQILDITLKAKANKLNAGNYSIKITVSSARQTSDPLFEKNIKLTVKEATGSELINSKEKKCMVSPNPFNKHVTFQLDNRSLSPIHLVIYTLDGRTVYSGNSIQSNENNKIEWDGCDKNKIQLQSGIYIYSLSSDNFQSTGKLIKVD